MNKRKYYIQPQIKASKIPKTLSKSSFGFSISSDVFAALPASNLKGKWVQLRILKPKGPKAVVPVGHVGPWNGGGWNNKYDDPYWIKKRRPQAESGKDLKGRKTDGAGISLSPKLWRLLGLGRKRKTVLSWHFVRAIRNKKKIIVNAEGERTRVC